MELAKTGVIHGRFQGLHLGHMEYLLAGKKRCDFLYIGITNPDPGLTAENNVDLKRSRTEDNPFTYYERMNMIRDALIDEGISRNEFEIIPFPINFPGLIKFYAPSDALYFVTVYDKWGEHKLQTLRSLGLTTDLMWVRDMSERFTTGMEVRHLIAAGQPWEHLVPVTVSQYIKKNKLEDRIKILVNENI